MMWNFTKHFFQSYVVFFLELLTIYIFADTILLARMQKVTVGCEKDDGLRH
jgi:hypothetical protein